MSAIIDERTGLEVLFRDECVTLLHCESVGRLAFVVGNQPVILPVNYVMYGSQIAFRTAEGTKLDWLRDARVAFEVDGVNEDTRTGWSVLVQGRSSEVTSEAERQVLDALGLEPWTATIKPHWIVVSTATITGRRIVIPGEYETAATVVDWAIATG
jgi:nitroimidazol reductase NimA-like FMN-containing flavoprotein (pyridoxamine 5'-phosphate oxidase superfamily)